MELKPEKFPHDTSIGLPSAWKGLENYIIPLIKELKVDISIALEFGVDYGYSTNVLSKVFDRVIGVDAFIGDKFIGHGQDEKFHQTVLETFKDSNVEIIKSDYRDFIKEETGRFGLIHVDINHTYQDTFKCVDWCLKHSDVVIAHDTESFHEVKRALNDAKDKHKVNFYNIEPHNGLGVLFR